ncbi:hypothetical protein DL95DRAFT_382989 [Leptodontidium sp. 2 PMI_412]|nr:hypothetical protein BKA61DRAFT_91768 [Leptodontidium sp. MPI-SDFR-AT-0119]KAH9220521.1 hypothetical protein DL95DRAFT_382989 [Leptodontidium sp. 2 PMI_412]
MVFCVPRKSTKNGVLAVAGCGCGCIGELSILDWRSWKPCIYLGWGWSYLFILSSSGTYSVRPLIIWGTSDYYSVSTWRGGGVLQRSAAQLNWEE